MLHHNPYKRSSTSNNSSGLKRKHEVANHCSINNDNTNSNPLLLTNFRPYCHHGDIQIDTATTSSTNYPTATTITIKAAVSETNVLVAGGGRNNNIATDCITAMTPPTNNHCICSSSSSNSGSDAISSKCDDTCTTSIRTISQDQGSRTASTTIDCTADSATSTANNTQKNCSNNDNTATSATTTMSDLVLSACDKAGMDHIDRIAIDAIIEKESGNSLYMQQQKKRDQKVNERIVLLRKKVQQQTQDQLYCGDLANGGGVNNSNIHQRRKTILERQIDTEIIQPSLLQRPIRSCKVVLDMDMFFMACELLVSPTKISMDQPACVGGSSMITTSNYAARKYGVRSAMPGYIGTALVHQLSKGTKQLLFYPINFPLYKEKSQLVRNVLLQYDPTYLSMYSLDEVYIDLAPYLYFSFIHPNDTHEQISNTLIQIKQQQQQQNSTSQIRLEQHDDISNHNIDNTDNKYCSSYSLQQQPQQSHTYNSDDATRNDSEVNIPNNRILEYYYDQLLHYSTKECMIRIESIVRDMRERVFATTGGLTCSAGIAPNFLLAKIASDINKPNGQCFVPSDHESILHFLHPLPIRKVSGIGRVTEKILRAFHITTVQQMYTERALIQTLFDKSSSTSNFLIRASVGCGNNDSILANSNDKDGDDVSNLESNQQQQKGISRERTIPSGKTWSEINSKLMDIANLLSNDMEEKQLSARTIYVKVKLHTFDVLSRGRTLPNGIYVHTSKDLIRIATELLHEIRQKDMSSSSLASSSSLMDNNTTTAITSKQLIDHGKTTKTNHNHQASHQDQLYPNGRQQFSVRLVGIRCTNFQSTTYLNKRETGSKGICCNASTQTTLDQFLQRVKTVTINNDESIIHSRSTFSSKDTSCSLALHKQAVDRKNYAKLFYQKNVKQTEPATLDNIDDAIDRKSDGIWVHCPICFVRILNDSNVKLNLHIDRCLNGRTVQTTVREWSNNVERRSMPKQTQQLT